MTDWHIISVRPDGSLGEWLSRSQGDSAEDALRNCREDYLFATPEGRYLVIPAGIDYGGCPSHVADLTDDGKILTLRVAGVIIEGASA